MGLDNHKIALILSNDSTAGRHWLQIYDALGLPSSEAEDLSRRVNWFMITRYELFVQMLKIWKSVNGNKAIDQTLEKVLRNMGLNRSAGNDYPKLTDTVLK